MPKYSHWFSITLGMTASLCLCSTASAQRYLPPSRYAPSLPSPNLLYPEREAPLYPDYEQAAPTPPPVQSGPLMPQPMPPLQSQPLPEPVPAPTYEPAPSQARPPAAATYAPAPLAAPAPAPALLPLPGQAGPVPNFQPLTTIETQQGITGSPPDAGKSPPAAMHAEAVPMPPAEQLPEAIPQAPMVAEAADEPKRFRPTLKDEPPEPELDAETRAILSRIPGGIDSNRRLNNKNATLDRYDPDIEGALDGADDEEVAEYESMGVEIEVRSPKLDITVALKDAYEALIGGQPQIAMQIYKDILRQSPRNQDALFGVATTYHRMGERELAKPFYAKLLKLNPRHRDGLTNFLSLIAQEAPELATSKLEFLASQNPDFGAIPALLGVLYDKMDKQDRALDSLIRAVRMEPDNVAYKYNLAILYDKYGMVKDATVLYNQLLEAGRSGIPLPAAMRDLQERVIHINTPQES